MRPGRIRLRQHLTIADVRHRRDELDVHVSTPTGGRERIRFTFADQSTLSGQFTRLRRWMHLGTPLTYVAAGGSGALIDDRALFEAAFGTPDLL
jgi:hypothetical protein